MRLCSCLKHSSGRTCGTCRYGVCPGCSYPNEIRCQRHAPQIGLSDVYGGQQRAQWPLVAREDWCGDYELREYRENTTPAVTAALLTDAPTGPDEP